MAARWAAAGAAAAMLFVAGAASAQSKPAAEQPAQAPAGGQDAQAGSQPTPLSAPPPGYGPPGQPAPGQAAPSPYPYPYPYPPPPGYGPPGQPAAYGYPPYYPGYGQPPQGGPRTLEYEEGAPIPPGYHLEDRSRRGMVIAGTVTFSTLYMLSLFAALIADSGSNDADELAGLYIPVVGPFISAAQNDDETGTAVLVLDGLGQTAGAALLVAGLVATRRVLVRDGLAGNLQITPVSVGQGGLGLGLGLKGAL